MDDDGASRAMVRVQFIRRINIVSTCAEIEVQTERTWGIPFRAILCLLSNDTVPKIYMSYASRASPLPRAAENAGG